MDRHCHIGVGVGVRRQPRRHGVFGKTMAVMTASVLAVGMTPEMPAQAVLSKQAARIQMHAQHKRMSRISRISRISKRTRVRHRRLGKMQRTKLGAATMVAHNGWSRRHFGCLNRLWMRESGWNHRARNPYSGAYGIPQALPAGKMRSAGRDWRTNPRTQIRWGLGYVKHRYGSPCRAWRHFEASGWY